MIDEIIKYLENNLTPEEEKSLFESVKSDPELKKELISLNNINGLIGARSVDGDEIAGKKAFVVFIRHLKFKLRRRHLSRVAGYVATLLIAIAGSWGTLRYLDTNDQIEDCVMNIPAGQRGQLTLGDGTRVWLNARSSLTFPSKFKSKERRVKLYGGGYFEVVHDAKSPFVVETDALDIRVLGTTFNVNSYNGREHTDVSLIEGKVEIVENSREGQRITLYPGECVTFTNDRMSISNFSNDDEFMWRDGIYAFDNTFLADIIAKLELYYDTRIIIGNDALKERVYTVKFRQRDGMIDILNVIRKVNYFEIHKDSENNIITIK